MCGWLAGWSYRKEVTITGQAGAGCPTDDALILTPEGLKHPQELKEGDYVISQEGLKKVLHNGPDYEDEIWEIDAVGGYKLRFSKNHRLPTNRGILRAFELKEGDILFEPFTNERLLRQTTRKYKKDVLDKYFIEKERTSPSEIYERSFYELKDCRIKEMLNKNITERDLYLAEMLGISDAEGKPRKYKTQRGTGFSLNISINEEEVDFLNRIKYLCNGLWCSQPRINKYNPDSKGITVACKTEAGKELLPYLDISIKEKFLFRNIRLLDAYCKGFWCGDGCELNGYKEVGQSEVNDDLKRFQFYLQLLGHRAGRFSSLNKKTGNYEWKVKWYKDSRQQFTRRITKVKRVEERTRIWRLAVEDEHYIFNGILSLNSNYQVPFSIASAAGGDFNLESHCTSFPNDIQVTDNDQETPLDYWVEDLTVDPIKMWVEVADDLGSNVDINFYYGKSGATTQSDGDATFLFFDDFSGNLNKWTTIRGSPTITSGVLQLESPGIGPPMIKADSLTLANFILEYKGRTTGVTSGCPHIMSFVRWQSESSGNKLECSIRDCASDDIYFHDGSNFHGKVGMWDWWPGSGTTHWIGFKVVSNGSDFEIYADDLEGPSSASTSATISSMPANGTIALGSWQGTVIDQYDNIRARKYNATEPAFSSAATEESAPSAAIMNQFQNTNLGSDLFNGALII